MKRTLILQRSLILLMGFGVATAPFLLVVLLHYWQR